LDLVLFSHLSISNFSFKNGSNGLVSFQLWLAFKVEFVLAKWNMAQLAWNLAWFG
jgi:hypothetical protein